MLSAERAPRANASPLRRVALTVCAASLLPLLAPATARADSLRILTAEAPDWPSTVAQLESDVHAEGRVVHVFVEDESGRRLRCGEYALQLDATASAAFVDGGCDAASGSTMLRLAHRGALFAHGDVVARPLPVAITAIQVRTGGANGGAAAPGGSTVTCSIAVHPYLTDLESGAMVYLTPGRWVLRPHGAMVIADPAADGWVLRSTAAAALTVDYDVFDTQRNEVVLHDQATLACGVHTAVPVASASTPSPLPSASRPPTTPRHVAAHTSGGCGTLDSPPDEDPTSVCASAPELQSGAPVRGSTAGQADHFRASCALGAASPDAVYLLRVTNRARVVIRLASNYDGAVYLRRDCGAPSSEIACNDDGPDIRHSTLDVMLDPGAYYVVVDGDGSECGGRNAGTYELTAWVEPR